MMKNSKLLTIIAVAMMVTTVFAAIASGDTDGTGGGVATTNSEPIAVEPVSINDSTSEGKLWDNCPNVTYAVKDGTPTITFNNANIEITAPSYGRCIFLNLGKTCDIVLKGNNEIHMKTDASSVDREFFGGSEVNIYGSSMKDSLTLSAQSNVMTNKDLTIVGLSNNGPIKISNCTIKFTLEKENDTVDPTARDIHPISTGDVICVNSKLIFSMGSAEKDYTFTGFWIGQSSFKDSIIKLEKSDKMDSNSSLFYINTNDVTFDCCKLEAEMTNGTVFKVYSGTPTITFDNFNWIDFYDDVSKKPTHIEYEGAPVSLTDWNVKKTVIDSNVKEPTDDVDNSVAVTVAIVASMLLAVSAVAIALIGIRR